MLSPVHLFYTYFYRTIWCLVICFEIHRKKPVLLCKKIKQLHHAVLHPCENKTQVITSEQEPAVQGISLLKLSYSKKVASAQMKAKSVQLGKRQIVSFTEKVPLQMKIPAQQVTLYNYFSGGLGFFFLLIWFCSFFKQLLKDFYHAKGYSNHPFTHNALDSTCVSVKHPRFQSQAKMLGRPRAVLSNRSDSPHFGRQSLLKPSLQILHVGWFWPWNKRGSPPLRGAGYLLFIDFFTEEMEGIKDVVIVFTDRYFIESTAQHIGQLKSLLRLHLFDMQEISFVCHDDDRDHAPWMQLSNVMVKVTE